MCSDNYNYEYIKNIIIQTQKNHSRFSNVAYLYYYFIDKLYNKIIPQDISELVFFSSEGQFLKKCFDMYSSLRENGNHRMIKTYYLFISRKSTYLPSLDDSEREDFQYLRQAHRDYSILNFLYCLNFTREQINNIKCELHFDITLSIPDFFESSFYQLLLQNKLFKGYYTENKITQSNYLTEYLCTTIDILNKKELNLVDIGWEGTTQNNLRNILPLHIQINGYYMCLATRHKQDNSNYKTGILYENIDNKATRNSILFLENYLLHELFLRADHGSVSHYYKHDDHVLQMIVNNNHERLQYKNLIRPLQDEIFDIFTKVCVSFINHSIIYTDYEKQFKKVYMDTMFNFSKEQVEFYNKLCTCDNFDSDAEIIKITDLIRL